MQADGRLEYTNYSKNWLLPSSNFVHYPPRIDLLEGEKIDIPYPYSQDRLFLFLYDDGNPVANFSKNMTLTQDKSKICEQLSISKLPAGVYRLWGSNNLDIKIYVHQGEVWPLNPKMIVTSKMLIERGLLPEFAEIKGTQINANGEVTIRMNPEARAHMILFNFLPESLDNISLNMIGDKNVRNPCFPIQKPKNYFLSNQEMNSELRYTFERKKMKGYTGNMLEKPLLLMKRNFVKITKTEAEQMTQGTTFEGTLIEDAPQNSFTEEDCYNSYRPSVGEKICLYQNFLKTAPTALWNMAADKDGIIKVQIDPKILEKYSELYIVCFNKGLAAHHVVPLENKVIETRDLALRTTLDSSKQFSEMRTTKCIFKNESYIFEDYASAETQKVDSLEKVLTIQMELLKNKIKLPPNVKKLTHWNSLAQSQKNQIFSEICSNELNLFIYKKDPTYFKSVVYPFIYNKMEKCFIDYYLFQDMKELHKYIDRPALMSKLNCMEKALLIEALANNGELALAKTLAQRLSDYLQKYRLTIQEQQRLFGIILSLKLGHVQDGNFLT